MKAAARPGRWVESHSRARGSRSREASTPLVAVIAVNVAAGAGGKPEDQRGALGTFTGSLPGGAGGAALLEGGGVSILR